MGGVGDRIDVVDERISGGQETLGADIGGEIEGEFERGRPGSIRKCLGPVGVGAAQFGLAMPEASEVEAHVGGHSEQHHPSTGPRDSETIADRAAGADRVDGGVGTGGELVADQMASDHPPHRSVELVRFDDDVGAEFGGEAPLVGVAGADCDTGIGKVLAQARDRREPHRSGPEHRDDRSLGRLDVLDREQGRVLADMLFQFIDGRIAQVPSPSSES